MWYYPDRQCCCLVSPPNSNELFYLWKLVGYGVAEGKLTDKYNPIILEGEK